MGKVLSKNITAVATIILLICLSTSFGNSFCNKEVANALSSWTVLTTSRFELTDFTLLNNGNYVAYPWFCCDMNDEIYQELSSERPDYVVPTVPGTSKTYEHNGLYLLRTDNAKDFYSAIDCSFEEFEEKFDYVEIPKEKIEYRHGSVFMPTDTGIYSKFVSTNVDVNKVYYYFFVVLKETTTINATLSGYSSTTTYSEVIKSQNYIDDSYANYARQKLISGFYGDDELALKTLRSIAGYSINSGTFNVFLKYKSLVNDNGDEITWKTENYQAQNLRSLDKKYVYNTLISLCGKSILSDFNVIRREVGYTVNGNSESAFLQDEYTLLEANGYDYVFDKNKNEGTLTITFGDYAAKDFPLVVRTNDELHSALFIRSGDIKTNGEKTTITFDTSNIKTRLSNNFSWNVDNTDFNNYVINNPHGNKVKFTKNYSGSDVSSITVETSDTNLLADCSLRLEIEVVPPVELTVTVKYLELKYSNGEFAETWKTKVLPNKIWSTQYTKINRVAFWDGDETIGIPAQGAFVNQNIAVSLDGKNIERLTYDGVTLSAADNTTATAMITVKYVRNTLFRILDSYTNKYTFVKAYGNSLNYFGADFIVEHDGYRVKSIVSENQQFAKVITTDGVYNWNNATIAIVCQLSAGNVIPLTVVYTDKWVVNVEYLDNYFSSIGDTSKPTGFAVKKTFDGEVRIKDDNGNLAFADINNPTGEEVAKFLGKGSVADLTVVGTFGAVKDISVSFANDVFTIRLSYHDTTLKILQADGTYEFVNIPFSCYGTWADSYGKDWSILALNTKDNVVFGSAGDIDRDSLYGYFYVSVFKEQVKNLDDLFAGYAADGCRSFYDCKKVVGSELYKRCSQMGTLGTILCLGTNKLVQAAGEILHDDYGTYYSYFLFVDGSSTLAYSANNKADNYFDHSSAIDNTIEDIGGDLAKWLGDNFGKVKSVLIVVGSIVLLCFVGVSVSKIIANIGNSGRRKRK